MANNASQFIHKIPPNINYSGAQKKGPCAKKVNPCAKKVNPCAKKSEPLCKKNEPRNKKLSVKNFIFFVDKLNMIDFNIFKIFKLIFTCESCAISITK